MIGNLGKTGRDLSEELGRGHPRALSSSPGEDEKGRFRMGREKASDVFWLGIVGWANKKQKLSWNQFGSIFVFS